MTTTEKDPLWRVIAGNAILYSLLMLVLLIFLPPMLKSKIGQGISHYMHRARVAREQLLDSKTNVASQTEEAEKCFGS